MATLLLLAAGFSTPKLPHIGDDPFPHLVRHTSEEGEMICGTFDINDEGAQVGGSEEDCAPCAWRRTLRPVDSGEARSQPLRLVAARRSGAVAAAIMACNGGVG